MSIISRMRKQKVCYWEPVTPDGRGGFSSFEEFIEIDARWDKTVERFTNDDGEEDICNAIAYVDRELVTNGFLFLGTSEELPDEITDPQLISGVYQIKSVGKIPNMKATEFLYPVYLKKG